MITIPTARILVICQNQYDQEYLEDFFDRIKDLPKPDFISGRAKLMVEKYHFLVFSGHLIGDLHTEKDILELTDEAKFHLSSLDYCIQNTNKYIVYFGKRYFKLNQERCPSANSKFTLFARIRELIDFMNHYRTDEIKRGNFNKPI